MRQLTLCLAGRSRLLQTLHSELIGHGHECHWADASGASMTITPDLLIGDGSAQPMLEAQMSANRAPRLSLSVIYAHSTDQALSTPELRVELDGRCICRDLCETEHGGNGRALHDAAMVRWIDTLADLIGQFARDPRGFATVPTCSDGTRTQITASAFDAVAYAHRGNQTAHPSLLASAQIPLSAQLEAAFDRHRHAIALRWQGGDWTYAQLRALAEPIRQYLLAGSWDQKRPTVGLCMNKGPQLFACVLGVLLADAVYLPLEPEHPLERRRYILENSKAQVLLQPAGGDLQDGPWQCIDPSPLQAVTPWPVSASWQLETPCMALYTSGTTGLPKGVALSQHNLSHFSAWYADYVALTAEAKVLQFSTLSFDSATIDLFPTWLSGACLVVANEDQRRDPTLLGRLIVREAVSHAFLPPALLSVLPLSALAHVSCIATGGDVCEPWVIEQLAGQCRFLNLYGPTEATVLITARPLTRGASNRSLGWPIANSQVWLLDDEDRPVRDGETAELYLIGPGVGLGYLSDTEQTRERYRTFELPDGERVRAYRTGDLGRWGPEGLELVGRRDNQVKIRGFRVEPEEVEQCLRQTHCYGQVAVVIRDQQRIVAFLARPLLCADNPLQRLREHVAERLPSYMQPAHYVELQCLPAAANGKVDRQALKVLPLALPVENRTPAVTARQRQLQGLWAELLELGADNIGIDESFFALGGHSILLSRLLLTLREEFGRSVSINRFIEQPTIERLEHLLDAPASDSPGLISPQALVDAERPLEVKPLPLTQLGDIHRVVVTGANSFVGVHIVQALLNWGASEVICLVRPGQHHTALERFEAALVDNRLELDLSRVQVLAADLSQVRFGLRETEYARLDERCGAVIHNAANVNHVLDYESLVPDNVDSLNHLLAFCEGRRKKILNFVSTLSACSTVDKDGTVLEVGPSETPPIYIRNGYNLSKWVGERILWRARQAGCFINLLRPGNISFNSETGVCQPQKNRLLLMLKGSLQLGAVPALELNFDLMPVDFLAKVIAFQASRYDPEAAVFNLHNPQPLTWTRYVDAFAACGHGFDRVPVDVWQTRLNEVDRCNALYGVLGFYLNGFEEDIGDISRINHENAANTVRRMGANYPEKDAALLARGCAYLHAIDFL